MNSEELFPDTGGFSYFQFYSTFIVAYARLICSMFIHVPVFTNHEQPLLCLTDADMFNNISTIYQHNFIDLHKYNITHNRNQSNLLMIQQKTCLINEINRLCKNVTLEQWPLMSTIRMQYKTYCIDRHYMVAATNFFCLLGIIFGYFFVGYITDKFGRLFSMSLFGVLGSGATFASNFAIQLWLHSLMRFFVGISVSGLFGSSNSYILETVPMKQRLPMAFIALTGYSIGTLSLTGISYYCKHSNSIQITVGFIALPAILCPFILPESFKWLITENKLNKALKSIRFITRFNRQTINLEKVSKNIQLIRATIDENHKFIKNVEIRELFKHRSLIAYTLIFSILLLNVSMIYYGIHFGLAKFSTNLFAFAFSINLIMVVMRVFFIIVSFYLGRVPVLGFMCGFTGIITIIIAIIIWLDVNEIIIIVFTATVGLVLDCAYSWIFLYIGEIFPTGIRTIALSLIFLFNGLGSLMAAIVMTLGSPNVPLYYLLNGLMISVICLAILFKLPETKDYPIFDELHDAEIHLKRRERYWLLGKKQDLILETSDNSV